MMPEPRVIDEEIQAFLQRTTSRTVTSIPPDFYLLHADDYPVTYAAPQGDA